MECHKGFLNVAYFGFGVLGDGSLVGELLIHWKTQDLESLKTNPFSCALQRWIRHLR